MGYILEAACNSCIGKRRSNNEDNFVFHGSCMEAQNHGTQSPLLLEQPLKQSLCLAVFDGMGGENYGEMAAFAAAKQLKEFLRKPRAFFLPEEKYLQKMAAQLNAAVVDEAHRLLTSRMGTTLAALYFTPGKVYSCNVGDSRSYRLRDHVFTQLSEDHVSKRPMPQGRKPPLTQHLGMDPQEVLLVPSISKGELQQGDQYLLCSDGLTDMVGAGEIADILTRHSDARSAVLALTDAALQNGGRDNITVIVCRVR